MVISDATRRGRLVVFEGIDGSGKSTQAARLSDSLGALLTSEPGATDLGADLRTVLLDPSRDPVSVRAEALLMAADRAEHVEKVLLPALRTGTWVVCDRYTASTIAYQGFGRGMDIAELLKITSFATGGLEPDVQVLLDLPVETARARTDDVSHDRLERLGYEFFERVRDGYLALAASDPEGWVVVEGSGDLEEVARRTLTAVTARLGWPQGLEADQAVEDEW
jgi:dTMP kinase